MSDGTTDGRITELEAEIEWLRESRRASIVLAKEREAEIERLQIETSRLCAEWRRFNEQTARQLEAEIERLTATNAGLVREAQKAWHEVERLRAVLRPLLKHYLNCYDGLEDQLAKDARAALERREC